MQTFKSTLGVIILSALTGGLAVGVCGVVVGRSLIKREVADQMQKREERFINHYFPNVNELRSDLQMPVKQVSSIEELIDVGVWVAASFAHKRLWAGIGFLSIDCLILGESEDQLTWRHLACVKCEQVPLLVDQGIG